MSKSRVTIELLPGRLDLVVHVGARILHTRRIPASLPIDVAEWMRALPSLLPELSEICTQLNLKGAPVRVLYRSPSQAVELPSYPVGSASQAVEAALLACTDALPYSASAVTRAHAAAPGASSDHPATFVLFAADREDVIQAIADLVTTAGLSFQFAVPVDVPTLHTLVAHLVAEQRFAAHLFIGEHSSFFLAGGNGSIALCRLMSVGVESLVSSLTLPLRSAPGVEPVELSAPIARRTLHAHGIPEVKTVICQTPRLTGAAAMAVLQPVLQRLVVELRQSLRFGLSEQQRQFTSLSISGPGATLRNLPAIIGHELGVQVSLASAPSSFDPESPAAPGSELALALRCPATLRRFDLQPAHLFNRRQSRRRRNWLVVGAVAALGFVGFDAFTTSAELLEVRRQADTLALQAAGREQLQLTADKLVASISAARSLQSRIDSELAARPDYRAILHELARLAPRNIRLTEINLARLSDHTEGSLTGYALLDSPSASHADLERFVETLRSSPLFESVTLGSIQAAQLKDLTGQYFQARFTATTFAPANPAVASAGKELAP